MAICGDNEIVLDLQPKPRREFFYLLDHWILRCFLRKFQTWALDFDVGPSKVFSLNSKIDMNMND